MGELAERREQTAKRLEELRGELGGAGALAAGKACVYATGSFGRGEASTHSDLDLFIAGKSNGQRVAGKRGSRLKRLDEICIKADLIRVTRKLGIPDFSGDGRWLSHHSVSELTRTLGTPEDDAANTFTARLLLLLESCPLLGESVYLEIVAEVIDAYWRDYPDHRTEFMPAFLANDILRLWRTFCVNYEAGTASEPAREKAKRKLKNYKLKHSRLLTCYSALLYLLAVYARQNSVSPADALAMSKLTPTRRLEWLHDQSEFAGARASISSLLDQYERFLTTTNVEEAELLRRFMDKNIGRKYMEAAYKFGDAMFEALEQIGATANGRQFHRLLVV